MGQAEDFEAAREKAISLGAKNVCVFAAWLPPAFIESH